MAKDLLAGILFCFLMPPGSEGFEFTDAEGVTWVHPGHKGSPEKWKKGTRPEKIN